MEVYRRSSWLWLILGVSLLANALQDVQGEAESEGPSESECRPYIEKALKELETGEAGTLGTPDSREDVPTVEVTTDDSDHHSDGEDDTHEEGIESAESTETEQKGQQEETEEQGSVEEEEEREVEKSAEETDAAAVLTESAEEAAASTETGKSKDDNEQEPDKADSKQESVEKKEEDAEEEQGSVEEINETNDESKEEPGESNEEKTVSSEDRKEGSQAVEESHEEGDDEKIDTVIKGKEKRSVEDLSAQEDDKQKPAESKEEKTEDVKVESEPVKRKNKWWTIEESDEKTGEKLVEKKTEQKVVDDSWKKANKWWHVDESGEVKPEKTEVKVEEVKVEAVVVESVKKKNKWWNIDESEVQVEEKVEKQESVISEEPKKKRNKWWNIEESDEVKTEENVEEPVAQPQKKRNKWWRTESDEATEEETPTLEKKEEKQPVIAESVRPKNKWWRTESEEEREQEKRAADKTREPEVEVEEPKPEPDGDKKLNKWWHVEESGEKEESVDDEKPHVEDEHREEPKQKSKWWKEDVSEEVPDSAEKKDHTVFAEDSKEDEDEENSEEDSGPAPEEELSADIEIPTDLRSREHVEHLLKLDKISSTNENIMNRVSEITLKELKKLYENAIKPLELLYKYRDLSNRHFGDSEIFSKPLILFMGPWSGGKSSIINYLLDNEYNETSLRTGAEPSPAYFNILMYGAEAEILDGTQLAADFTFSGLQKFGQGLEERLRGVKLPNKLLEKVNIVEIPGILEVRKQVSRLFPFNDACQWFIDRADIIFLVYDPSKLDVGPETEAILDQLKGREHQTRIILNKADQIKPEELMRVQGALIWNISPLMSSAQPPVMYTTSLWSKPYESWAPVRLLHAQERAFLRDLRSAVDKRIDNKIASARRFAVRVRNHAKMVDCYLTTYYNHKSVFGNRKQVADEIIEHPQDYHIYEGLSTLTNISRYDLPDPDVYKDFFKLNALYDFQQLSATCTYFRGCPINRLDVAIAYDLPELVGKHKRLVEAALAGGHHHDHHDHHDHHHHHQSAPVPAS